MGEAAAQTCASTSPTTSVMAYGCDLTRVFTYGGSQTDIYINCEFCMILYCPAMKGDASSAGSN